MAREQAHGGGELVGELMRCIETRNEIAVALPRDKVIELYTCTDLLPSWSPGLISVELLSEGSSANGPIFKQRYVAMGREIEEIVTVLEDDLPNGLHFLAENGGTLTRESRTTFEDIDEATTRLVVENRFSGEHVPHLVHQDLHDYTQHFLKTFKTFAESR